MTPTPEMITLAERVLALHGPIIVRRGCWCDVDDTCTCQTTRALTAVELATPELDGRPGAHLWALFWTQPESCLETRVDGIAAWISGRWMTKPTHYHAMLAALAAAGEVTP